MAKLTSEQYCLVTNLAILRDIDRSLGYIFECEMITQEQLREIRVAVDRARARHDEAINYQHP